MALAWDYSCAEGRWAGVGPYYAMFPNEFAFDVINDFSRPGDLILDPYAGRGTTAFVAGALGRSSIGVEINPVGWLYGAVKCRPASQVAVSRRLAEICALSSRSSVVGMPEFFEHCFSELVLKFLLSCRSQLNWRTSRVDATLMALILIYLHGKQGYSLSNQMRQGKAMAPAYSVAWWREHGSYPPEINPHDFLSSRIAWRYKKGIPNFRCSRVILGDSRSVLPRTRISPASLLLTSPPYCGITNYHYDQWLRLWILGGPSSPTSTGDPARGRFASEATYETQMRSVFAKSKRVLCDDAVVYVRTDARTQTLDITRQVLCDVFPDKRMEELAQPLKSGSQTALFGDHGVKPGDVDIILT